MGLAKSMDLSGAAAPGLADIEAATRAIAGVADRTPLIRSTFFSRLAGQDALLKLETLQPMGAFKLRGALAALTDLPQSASGVICCSTGNHGRAVAYAARARGMRAVVCMSGLVPRTKVDAVRALGAEVRIVGRSQDEAMGESHRLAGAEGLVEVPPFDDPSVIAGQGTIGLELLQARPDLDTILVPLSGGGLAAGIALAVKALKPGIRVIGVSMERGAAMYASLLAGRPVQVEEGASLADSLGGGIGLENRWTFELCRTLLDETHLVREEEIYRAMQALYWEDGLVAEGACVVGLAALLSGRLGWPKGPWATIITGRNVDMRVFTRVVTGQDVTLADLHIAGSPYSPEGVTHGRSRNCASHRA